MSDLLTVSWWETVTFWQMVIVPTLYNTNSLSCIFSAISPKQQSESRHVAPLGHIMMNLGQLVFVFAPYCCVRAWEATTINLYNLVWPRIEPSINRTRSKHYSCTSKSNFWDNWTVTEGLKFYNEIENILKRKKK